MALKKIIANQKGVLTSYHKIQQVIVTKNPRPASDGEVEYSVMLDVASFVSESYRQESETLNADGKKQLITCTLDELVNTPLLKLCYDKLKALPLFKDAEDC